MPSSTISKKRKRGADDEDKIALKLSSEPVSKVGPVLGTHDTQFAAQSDPFISFPYSQLSVP